MTPETLRAAILDCISRNRGTSFVELEWEFGRLGYAYEGQNCILAGPENVLIWVGWSEEAAEALLDLLRAGKAYLNPTSALTYMVDGKMLNYPIPKRLPRKGYKHPHWMPCTVEAGAVSAEPRHRERGEGGRQ